MTASCTSPRRSSMTTGNASATSTVAWPRSPLDGRATSRHRRDQFLHDRIEEAGDLPAAGPVHERQGHSGRAEQHQGVLGGGLATLVAVPASPLAKGPAE